MPGKVKVRILAGRNLPVMDRSSDTTDAYVEVKIGNTTYKTDVYRKSLNPQWNSEWFIFEVDDLELQDEPLQIRLMDHDTYSSDDAIGKVYIDLNPLLFVPAMSSAPKSSNDSSNAAGTMTGWLPVFDTMHGIRGEVNVLVKVDLFSDFNKFRQSSCGVQFFFTSEIPAGFKCNSIIGFAEELVINDDPEYQWIDKIRTPRASNEARQTLFSKLSGELQRRIGLKVQDQGGNAVLGYRQCFDLEGESGIVVRGIGSIVSLAKIPVDGASVPLGPSSISPCRDGSSFEGQKDLVDPTSERSSLFTVSPKRMSRSRKTSGGCTSRSPQMTEGGTENAFRSQSPTNGGLTTSPTQNSGHNRRSSESDISITPKGNCVHGGACPGGKHCTHGVCKNGVKSMTLHESFDNIIYPFLTMKKFPPDFIVHLGGTVSARSVKILDRNYVPDEMDSRDSWWSQIRTEIRSHARSIACNVVLGYEEFTTICDDICILNATGTAAVINICSLDNEGGCAKPPRDTLLSTSLERKEEAANVKNLTKESQVYLRHKASSPRPLRRLIQQNALCRSHPNVVEEMSDPTMQMSKTEVNKSVQTSSVPRPQTSCSLCHIPYDEKANPFNMKISKCGVCKSGKVPDILLTTLEIPTSIPVTGRGCFIQARVVRAKKDLKGELNAKEISDSLPFLEYELHKQLYHKIMVKGMNALFGLRVRVTIGEKIVVGVGTGTAVFLTSLPPPPLPKVTIAGTGPEEEAKRMEVQRRLQSVFEKNKEMYGLKDTASDLRPSVESKSSDTDDSDDDRLDFDLSCGNKGAFVLDLDDTEDVEMLSLLTEETKPCNFITAVTTQTPPGFSVDQSTVNLQMFTKIWISKVPPHIPRPLFSSYFETLMKSICFKVRNLTPCVLSGLKVDVALPEPDELQICILGMIMGQGLPSFQKKNSSDASKIYKTEELIPELKRKKIDESDLMFPMEEVKGVEDRTNSIQELNEAVNGMNMNGSSSGKNSVQMCSSASFAQSVPSVSSTASFSSSSSSGRSVNKGFERHQGHRQILSGTDQFGIDITPLSFIPGTKILRYLSNLNFFFIRESTSLKENGGLSGFLGSFVTEVLALVRAHVAALGGNALISYFLNECILFHNPHKNQAQCLINVGGDIVQVSYPNLSSNLRYRPDSCNHIPSSTQESAGE